MKNLKYNFLKDSPDIENIKSIEFYHKEFAPALKNILKNNNCLHTFVTAPPFLYRFKS